MPIVFPVSGDNHFFNDWGQPRNGGRTHEGTDIFAKIGTPVVAPAAGRLKIHPIGPTNPNTLGGNSASVTEADGTYYYFAHLSAFQGGDRNVAAGDVIGFVGDTGNAKGTTPHLHFEVHPQGGGPINPYPLLLAATRTITPPARAAQSSAGNGVFVALGVLAVTALGIVGLQSLSKKPARRPLRRAHEPMPRVFPFR